MRLIYVFKTYSKMLNHLGKFYGCRRFSRTNINRNLEKAKPDEPVSASSVSNSNFVAEVIPSKFEKKVLLWTGKFKSEEDIPHRISFAVLDNAKSKMRIKGANIIILGTIIMFGCFIYVGKKQHKKGDGILKREIERIHLYKQSKE